MPLFLTAVTNRLLLFLGGIIIYFLSLADALSASPAYDAWALGHFNAAQLADPAVSAPAADPDHDSTPNIGEFFAGSDPLMSDLGPSAELVETNGALHLQIRRNPDAEALAVQIEESNVLSGWKGLNPQPSMSVDTLGGWDYLNFPVPTPKPGDKQRFWRARISLSPAGTEDTVWYLSDPELPQNFGKTYHVVGTGLPDIIATCDGDKWIDKYTQTEIVNWWLPPGALFHVDLEQGHFYWDGEVKSLSGLIDNGNGSYMVQPAAPMDFSSGEQIVVFDYTIDFSNDRSGTLWILSTTPGTTSIRASPAASSPFISAIGNYYINSGKTITLPLVSVANESSTFPGTGRHRHLLRLVNGLQIQHQPDNGEIRDVFNPRVVTTIPNFTKIGLGCSINTSGAATSPVQNTTLHRLTIYNRDMNEAGLEAVGRTGIAPPVHILGDSFATMYRPAHNFTALLDGYIGISQDAVGGTSIFQQYERYRDNAGKWRRSTLVLLEGGASGPEMGNWFELIKPLVQNGRYLVLGSAPQPGVHEIGMAGRDSWLANQAVLAAAAGDNWVPTLESAYLEADGSPEDAAEVAKGLWPLSLKKSVTDFHPSARGDEFLARVIKQALEDRGWLPKP